MAIEVHWKTGPGLIESVYAALKCLELEQAGISLSRTSRNTRFLEGHKIPQVSCRHTYLDFPQFRRRDRESPGVDLTT
jgi:PD-(D/E)XK nuclease superfamily